MNRLLNSNTDSKELPRKIFILFLIVELGICILLCIGSVGLNYKIKMKLASVVFETVKNDMISKDYRHTILVLNSVVDSNFEVISFYGINNQPVFIIPPNYSDVKSPITDGLLPMFSGILEYKLLVGNGSKEQDIGVLKFIYDPFEFVFISFFVWFLVVIASLPFLYRWKKYFEKRAEEQLRISKTEVIAKTTQMLAHDIRKPFSMLESTLQIFLNCSNFAKLKNEAKEAIPEIKRAIKSVDGMLKDVLEIDSKAKLQLESTPPEALIEMSVVDLLKYQNDADIELQYDFNHDHQVYVDFSRIIRVFSNIFGNALQAMNYQGQVWFKTVNITQKDKKYIEFTIGNNGSFIEEEDRIQLFEAFFTKGKKNGTGLGLAISKKMIESHDGHIWCESDKTRGTEFKFVIPTSDKKIEEVYELPTSSKEIIKYHAIDKSLNFDEHHARIELEEITKETNISNILRKNREKFSILIVDDERIYRNQVRGLIDNLPSIKENIEFFEAKCCDEAIKITKENNPTLIFMDIDLNETNRNGFDAIKIIRESGYNGTICIHSNRYFREHNQAIFDCGADTYLPKPVSKIHLLKLLEDSMRGICDEKEENSTIKTDKIIILDDNNIYLTNWRILPEVSAITYDSPEAFWRSYEQDASLLDGVKCIVTDFHFESSKLNGVDYAHEIHKRGIDLPIFLSSNRVLIAEEEMPPHVDKLVPKSAVEAYPVILRYFEDHIKSQSKTFSDNRCVKIADEPVKNNLTPKTIGTEGQKQPSLVKHNQHDFNDLQNSIRDYLAFFANGVFENEHHRKVLKDCLPRYFEIIETEKSAITMHPQKGILWDILRITREAIEKTYELLERWPDEAGQKAIAINGLSQARAKLFEYKSLVKELQ